MSIRINDWFVAGNAQKTNSDWNAETGFAQILNKPTNLAHTTGNETLAGIKTFSSIPQSVTPDISSNDTSVPTTSYVVSKIAQHNVNATAHNDIRQSITTVSNSITSSINNHNIDNSAHSDIRQLINNTNTNISTLIGNHNNSTLSHSDIRLSVSNNSNLITSISNDLTQETSQRNSDVNYLQQQIDALSSKGDVADIVGTYQDLLNYDTSTLLNKSIIKVLSDSTHDNASSYYKWNANTSAFDYVGSEAPTYNKTEIDEMDNGVVHKAGSEEITGAKTFKNTTVKGGFITSTSTTNDRYFEIQAYDESNNLRGTYQVWRTNDSKTQNIIRASNTIGNTCEIMAIVADDGTSSTFAPTPAVSSNDNNIATTGWVSNTNLSTNVVHRADAETISGQKTFTIQPIISRTHDSNVVDERIKNSWSNIKLANSEALPASTIFSGFSSFDGNNFEYSTVYSAVESTGMVYSALWVQTPNGTASNMGIRQSAAGVTTTFAPTPPTGDNSTQIVTTAWCVDPALSTNLVHRSGDETIGGNKTFSNTINGTAYRAQWGDLAEYYLVDKQYPKGTLVQFGGDKEITIAKNKVNAVITSEPGFILNGELTDSQAIALIGRVPVRVIGKVKKFDKIALSYIDGVGCVSNESECPIGIALEDKTVEDEGLIVCSVKINLI